MAGLLLLFFCPR